MQKDFITVTPDSGSNSGEVTVTADMNPQLKEHETTLNFSATGGSPTFFIYNVISHWLSEKNSKISPL